MTISSVYADNRKKKRSADYWFTIRRGDIIDICRYASKEEAKAARAKLEEPT